MAITKVTSKVLENNVTVAGNLDVSSGTIKLDGNYPTGTNNVILGDSAFSSVTSADSVVAIGFQAATSNTSGSANVAIGRGALYANTTASNNTAVGYLSLSANTTGAENTAVGSGSLDANTTGNNSVALGRDSLTDNTTGSNNTGLGDNALANNTTASNNTAIGKNALLANTTGTINTAVGAYALDANTTATYNTALGYQALTTCTTGGSNVAIGSRTLAAMTTATRNTALGEATLFRVTTGANNTALGCESATQITTGTNNTCVGTFAGGATTTGSENVYIGYQSGTHNTSHQTGGGCVILGPYCDTDAADTAQAIVIGYDVTGTQSTTTIGSGSSDIRTNHGSTAWATVSDERVKKDITDATAGLSFINDLRPRTFKYKNKGDLPETFKGYEEDSTEVFKFSTTEHGFIAQEVKTAIDNHPEIKDGFKMWSERETGQQEIAEAALIPILVKALQEADNKIDALTTRIEALES